MGVRAFRDVIVVGASAGGVVALRTLVGDLPADLPASVFVVLHIPPGGRTQLPQILERAGRLPAVQAADGTSIERGKLYVAAPGAHMLLKRDRIRHTFGPRVNGHRPAIDPLFRSAAQVFGPRVIGVILSGSLDDGTAGLASIKARGGMAVVLDPADASYPGMPRSAIESVAVDHISPLLNLGALLDRLSREEVIDERGDQVDEYVDVTEQDPLLAGRTMPGLPSEISCPECSGTLYEVDAENVTRFECHVGHSFSPEALVDGQANALEGALWTALRTLEESALLAHRMVHRMNKRGSERAAGRFAEKERELRARAEVVRGALLDSDPGPRANEESDTGGIRSIS